MQGTRFNKINHRYNFFENYGKVFLYLFCCQIFSVKKTINNWKVFIFLFHETHEALFTFHHGRSAIPANRHTVISLKLMSFKKRIHFRKYLLSDGIFSKWTAKQKLLHILVCVKVSHKHNEQYIISDICCLIQLQTKVSTALYRSNSLLQNIFW